MLDIIKYSFKNLYRKKIRSSLTILGVCISVMSVIVIGNISRCGTSALTSEFDSLGLGGLTITTDSPYLESCSLTENELEIIKENSNVKQASPIIMQSTSVYAGFNNIESVLWGIDSKLNQIISMQVLYGRDINNADIKLYNNVCMVDQNFSNSAYGVDNIVGKKISILCGDIVEDYEVVGIIKTGNGILQNFIGDYIPNFVYIPYTTMQKYLGKKSFDQIAVKIKDNKNLDDSGNEIVKSILRTNGLDKGFRANNLSKQRQGLNNILNIINMILSLVGIISLFVASLSIMTVMLVSVNERTKEIGIKKSIGANKKVILTEFLFEAFMLSLIGCILGIVLGTSISFIGTIILGVKLQIGFRVMMISIVFSMLTAIVFGVYPAIKAANLKPVDALRRE